MPPGIISSSDQLTSSFDNRYERKGSGIYSSSAQLGLTGIYSGSGIVRSNTVVSASNLKIETSQNSEDFYSSINFDSNFSTVTNDLEPATGSLTIITGRNPSNPRSFIRFLAEENILWVGSTDPNDGYSTILNAANGDMTIDADSGSQHMTSLAFEHGQLTIIDYRIHPTGIHYGGNYTSSIKNNNSSLSDIRTVKLLLSESVNYYSSSFETRGRNIISSSNQIAADVSGSFTTISSSFATRISTFETKTLVSGSEQITSSLDTRYHRLGTGLISSSNQIDYNQLTNKIINNESGLGQILISSGSSSSSYGDPTFTYNSSTKKLSLTGSLFITGGLTPRLSYTWQGPITVGPSPGIVWTNMPAVKTNWLNSSSIGIITNDSMYVGDFTEITEGRLFSALSVAAARATASLEVEYSSDGVTNWQTMLSLVLSNTIGLKDTGWVKIPTGSQSFNYIRLTGQGSDAAADPRFSPPIALFR